jgi:hypothetical protein
VPRGHLDGVSCVSAGACTAVGNYKNSAGTFLTLAEQWNGRRWSIQTTPNPTGALTSSLFGVSCVSAGACTAVGDYKNSAGTLVTLAEQWNGRRWSIQATPNPTGALTSSLFGVSCVSAGACTAVGSYTSHAGGSVTTATLAEVWNGTSWAIQATPNPSGLDTSQLIDVSCVSTGACTAVGTYTNFALNDVTLAEQWDGTSWAIQTTPNPTRAHTSDLNGVSCVSADACTAVGDHTNGAGTEVTLAEWWNGTSWAIQTTPNPTGAHDSYMSGFNGVSCVSAGECTAVGAYTDRAGTFVTLAERLNGRRWAIQTTPHPTGAHDGVLDAVSCVSAGACTAVGDYKNRAGTLVTLAERRDGRH